MCDSVLHTRSYLSVAIMVGLVGSRGPTAFADHEAVHFLPGNLVISRSVYGNDPSAVTVGMTLPPNCASTSVGCPKGATATNDGSLPLVWNNSLVDSSFGITSKIFLDQLTPLGRFIDTLEVPNSTQPGVSSRDDQLVTSFPSKSELALNLSTDHRRLSFMGYVAPVAAVDVSNSNTPLVADPTNPVGVSYDRAVADVDARGRFHFTLTNAYSGNNGRAAVLHREHGTHVFYMAGNAGNGGNPQPDGIITGAGAQIATRQRAPERAQSSRSSDARRQLQHHAAGPAARQDWEGHQLSRADDSRRCRLLHEGERRERHQHGVFRRYHGARVPDDRSGSAGRRSDTATRAARVRHES